MDQYDRDTRTRALKDLGITAPDDFTTLQRTPLAQAQQMLVEMKERVKKNYKRLCVELHPDRTNNDLTKTEWMKVINYEYTEFQKLEVQPPQPQPQMVFINLGNMFTNLGGNIPSNGTTTGFAGNGFSVTFRVVKNGPNGGNK